MMTDYKQIGRHVYDMAPCLTDIRYELFGRSAHLELRDDDGVGRAYLHLETIHLWCMRQFMLLPQVGHWRDDNSVSYLSVDQESEFLSKFIDGSLGFSSDVPLHDSARRKLDSPGFLKPLHVVVVCDAGLLDVICEKAWLEV